MNKVIDIENRIWQIYTLSHPITQEIRYVGVTFKTLQQRLSLHLCNKKGFSHRVKWINSLVKRDLKPVITCIQKGIGVGWQKAEIEQIAYHRSFCDLVNATDGGEGCVNLSQEVRLRLSEANKGKKRILSQEARLKLSEAHKGKTISQEIRLKLSEAHKGKGTSLETRLKMSEAHKGKTLSLETRLKMSESKKGKRHIHTLERGYTKKSESKKGNKYSLGKIRSQETCLKLSEARKIAVVCVETGQLYFSIKEMCSALGVNYSHACGSIRKGYKIKGNHYQHLDKLDITKLPPSTKLQQLRLF